MRRKKLSHNYRRLTFHVSHAVYVVVHKFFLEVIVPKLLSEDLAYWRSERPDEWTMDRFITAAKALEEKLTSDNNASTPLKKCADCKHGEGENPTPYGSHCYACCKDCKPFFEQRT